VNFWGFEKSQHLISVSVRVGRCQTSTFEWVVCRQVRRRRRGRGSATVNGHRWYRARPPPRRGDRPRRDRPGRQRQVLWPTRPSSRPQTSRPLTTRRRRPRRKSMILFVIDFHVNISVKPRWLAGLGDGLRDFPLICDKLRRPFPWRRKDKALVIEEWKRGVGRTTSSCGKAKKNSVRRQNDFWLIYWRRKELISYNQRLRDRGGATDWKGRIYRRRGRIDLLRERTLRHLLWSCRWDRMMDERCRTRCSFWGRRKRTTLTFCRGRFVGQICLTSALILRRIHHCPALRFMYLRLYPPWQWHCCNIDTSIKQ